MSTINIKCVDQVLAFQNMPIITAGDQNVDKVQFDFCPLWDGFVKVAVFFQQKTECSYALINADGSCNIPNSILKLSGKIFIAVTGTNPKNQVRTSNILSYFVDEGIVDADIQDEFPSDITDEEKQDIYNQILTMCTDMQALCQDLIKNFAYVRIKDANEFEYNESMIEAKIRAYTYNRSEITEALDNIESKLSAQINAVNTTLSTLITTNNNTTTQYIDSKIANLNDNINSLTTAINSEIATLRSDLEQRCKGIEDTINMYHG